MTEAAGGASYVALSTSGCCRRAPSAGPPQLRHDTLAARSRARSGDRIRRVQQAFDLRVQGYDWTTIAERCGYASKHTAHTAVSRLRQGIPQPDLEEMRNRAALVLIRHAAEDVAARRPGAVTAQVRAEGRLAALCGLDAPKRTVSETYEEQVSSVFAWLARTDDAPPSWELAR